MEVPARACGARAPRRPASLPAQPNALGPRPLVPCLKGRLALARLVSYPKKKASKYRSRPAELFRSAGDSQNDTLSDEPFPQSSTRTDAASTRPSSPRSVSRWPAGSHVCCAHDYPTRENCVKPTPSGTRLSETWARRREHIGSEAGFAAKQSYAIRDVYPTRCVADPINFR